MNKIVITFVLLIGLTWSSQAQTKLISHKSHSGSKKDFKRALEYHLFDMDASNFGQAPMRRVKDARLDSLIHLSDSSAIMITSNLCMRNWTTPKDTVVWSEGTDTLFYHPLFTKKHALDSIKKVLDEQYFFGNKSETVEFIGYDNEVPENSPPPPVLTPKDIKEDKKMKKKLKKQRKKQEKSEKKAQKKGIKKVYVSTNDTQKITTIATIKKAEIGFIWQLILGLGISSLLMAWVFTRSSSMK